MFLFCREKTKKMKYFGRWQSHCDAALTDEFSWTTRANCLSGQLAGNLPVSINGIGKQI
jgi:hypothetical protein